MSLETRIWNNLKRNIQEVLPDIDVSHLQHENSLRELGANSIDRAEIIMLTLKSLNLKIPLSTFSNARNMGELISLMLQEMKFVGVGPG